MIEELSSFYNTFFPVVSGKIGRFYEQPAPFSPEEAYRRWYLSVVCYCTVGCCCCCFYIILHTIVRRHHHLNSNHTTTTTRTTFGTTTIMILAFLQVWTFAFQRWHALIFICYTITMMRQPTQTYTIGFILAMMNYQLFYTIYRNYMMQFAKYTYLGVVSVEDYTTVVLLKKPDIINNNRDDTTSYYVTLVGQLRLELGQEQGCAYPCTAFLLDEDKCNRLLCYGNNNNDHCFDHDDQLEKKELVRSCLEQKWSHTNTTTTKPRPLLWVNCNECVVSQDIHDITGKAIEAHGRAEVYGIYIVLASFVFLLKWFFSKVLGLRGGSRRSQQATTTADRLPFSSNCC